MLNSKYYYVNEGISVVINITLVFSIFKSIPLSLTKQKVFEKPSVVDLVQ